MDCQIPANPDIDGIGVRAALYAQTFIAILTYFVSPYDSLDAWTATIITSIALEITALASLSSLTLYHALLVTWLAFPATAFTVVYEIVLGSQRSNRYILFIGGRLCSILYFAFLLWVWITAPYFGQTPACNDTVAFALFARIHVNNGIRYWIIYTGSSSSLVYLAACIVFVANVASRISPRTSLWWAGIKRRVRPGINTEPILYPYPEPEPTATTSLIVAYTFALLVFLAFSIAMTELTIRWNNVQPGSSQWTYGQIIAVILLAAPLLSIQRAVRTTLSRNNEEPLTRRPLAFVLGKFARWMPARIASRMDHLVEREHFGSEVFEGGSSVGGDFVIIPSTIYGFTNATDKKLLKGSIGRRRAFSV